VGRAGAGGVRQQLGGARVPRLLACCAFSPWSSTFAGGPRQHPHPRTMCMDSGWWEKKSAMRQPSCGRRAGDRGARAWERAHAGLVASTAIPSRLSLCCLVHPPGRACWSWGGPCAPAHSPPPAPHTNIPTGPSTQCRLAQMWLLWLGSRASTASPCPSSLPSQAHTHASGNSSTQGPRLTGMWLLGLGLRACTMSGNFMPSRMKKTCGWEWGQGQGGTQVGHPGVGVWVGCLRSSDAPLGAALPAPGPGPGPGPPLSSTPPPAPGCCCPPGRSCPRECTASPQSRAGRAASRGCRARG
jgi:hypothetical protein